ncbi:MAG: hypothetical protein LIO50_01230 [Phascolarctobacterium sp.]|nr:hypothetical protein [Phascolarctobacterium sp.]MCC8157842.1 hypothetical protein [Phascolarctobacterium sp.]
MEWKINIEVVSDGKRFDKTYWNKNLPEYVQHDIDTLIIGRKEKVVYPNE